MSTGVVRLPEPTLMRAAVLGSPGEIKLTQHPIPKVGVDEVLVRVHRASLCGTDVKILEQSFFGKHRPVPFTFIPGHEYAGVVADVGSSVDEFRIGDRVVSESHRGCMRCSACLHGEYTNCLNYGQTAKGHRAMGMTVNGGFADYVVNHVSTLHRLPDSVGFDEAVILTTAGTAMHALDRLNSIIVGARIIIIGAGPIGLLAVQVAKQLGATAVGVLGRRAARLDLAKVYGADAVVDVEFSDDAVKEMRANMGGRGAHIVLECSGSDVAVDQALALVERSGSIILVGFFGKPVNADLNAAVMNGITVYGIRGEGRDAVPRAISLAAEGRLTGAGLVTHHFPLEQVEEAFATYMERRDGAIKVMLDVQPGQSAGAAQSRPQ